MDGPHLYPYLPRAIHRGGLLPHQPYGLLFDEITASSLIVVDFDGNVVRGDHPYNDAGHAIHSVVLMKRPDVNWVLHSHTRGRGWRSRA